MALPSPYANYNALKLIGVYYPRPDLYAPYKPYVPKPSDQPPLDTHISDYNDPLAVNSLVDVLFNEAALNKNYADPNDTQGVFDLADISQRVTAAIDLTKRLTIDPIVDHVNEGSTFSEKFNGLGKGIGEAAINSLMNLGETMDIAANPIKGAILNKDHLQGFLRGLGVTEEGRYNYDYDIQTGSSAGNFIANMAAEVVSDPLNWVSFGVAGAAKVAAKGLQPVAEAGIKEFVSEVAEAGARKTVNEVIEMPGEELIRKTSQAFSDGITSDVQKRLAQNLAKNIARNPDDIANVVADTVRNANIPEGFSVYTDRLVEKLTDKLADAAMDSMSLQVMKSLKKLDKVSDIFQKGLMNSIIFQAGALPLTVPAKYLANETIGYVYAKAYRALKPILAADGTIPITMYEDARNILADALAYTAHLDEVPEGLAKEIATGFVISSEALDRAAIHNILKDNIKDVTKIKAALDEYYALKTNGAFLFDDYVEMVRSYEKTHPEISSFANELYAIDNSVKALDEAQMEMTAKDLDLAIQEDIVQETAFKLANSGGDAEKAKQYIAQQLQLKKDAVANLNKGAVKNKNIGLRTLKTAFHDAPEILDDGAKLKYLHVDRSARDMEGSLEVLLEKSPLPVRELTTRISQILTRISKGTDLYEFSNYADVFAELVDGLSKGKVSAQEFIDSRTTVLRAMDTVDTILTRGRGFVSENLRRYDNVNTDALQTISAFLQRQLDYIDALEKRAKVLFPVTTINVKDTEDLILYHLKMAQASVNFQMLERASDFRPYMQDIIQGRGLAADIRALNSPELDVLAEALEVAAQGQTSYTNLLNTLAGSPTTKNIFLRLFDTLQTYARYDLNTMIMANTDVSNYYIERIIAQTQSQMMSIANKNRYSLEAVFKNTEIQDAFDKHLLENYPDVLGRHSHDAVYDVLATEYLFKHPELLQNYTGDLYNDVYTNMFIDIETLGLNYKGNQITQISYILDGKVYELKVDVPKGMIPDGNVLHKLTGEDDPVRALEVWEDMYVNKGNPTEDAVLTTLSEAIRVAKETTGKPVRLVGHNIDGFDKMFMAGRSVQLLPNTLVPKLFTDIETLDTLTLFRLRDGIQYITEEQKKVVRAALFQYFSNRLYEPLASGAPRKFIDGIDVTLARKIKDARGAMRRMPGLYKVQGTDVLFEKLGQFENQIYDTLMEVKTVNREMANWYVMFNPATKEFIGKDMQPIKLGDILNTTQLFAADIGDMMMYASKKDFVKSEYSRFFHLSDEIKINDPDLYRQYQITKSLIKKADRIADLAKVAPYHSLIPDANKMLYDWLASQNKVMPGLILDPTGTADRFAVAHMLYTSASQTAKTTGNTQLFNEVVTKFLGDSKERKAFFGLLTDPNVLRPANIFKHMKRFSEEEQTLGFFSIYKTELYQNGALLAEAQEELKTIGIEDLLKTNSIIKEDNSMVSATVQAENAVLLGLHDIEKQFTEHVAAFEDHKYTQVMTREYDAQGTPHMILKDKKDLDYLRKIKQAIERNTDGKALAEISQIISLPAEDLRRHLFENCHGALTFGIPWSSSKIVRNKYNRTTNLLYSYKDELFKRSDELLESGIHLEFNEADRRVWMVLDNEEFEPLLKLAQGEKFSHKTAVSYTSVFDYDRKYNDIFNDLDQAEQYLANITRGRSIGSLGDTMEFDDMKKVYDAMPDKLKRFAIKPERFQTEAERFTYMQFNRSNIGTVSSRKQIMAYVSRNPLKNYASAAERIVHRLDGRLKFSYMFFDEANMLDGPIFGKNRFSNEEIFEMLQAHPEYKLAGLRKHEKYGMIVTQFKPNSAALIEEIRKSGPVTIMPTQTFLKAWRTINDFQIGGNASRLLKKYIISPTKTGYLMSLGWIVRNLVDSCTKNVMLTGSFVSTGDMAWHTLQTFNTYRRYREALQDIYAEAQKQYGVTNNKVFSRKIAEEYLNRTGAMTPEDFFRVHDFIEQGPSAGLSQEQSKLLKQRRELKTGEKEETNWLYNNPYTRFIMNTNGEVEQIMRLSGYTWSLNTGKTVDQAMFDVMKHHFDYTVKSPAMMYAEYVIPFLSFTVNNTAFWINALDTAPWLASIFRDVMTPVWNFDEYSNIEINNNRSLQYHILAGNIVDPDDNLVIKLNPSILDALTLVTDPSAWYDRIIPVARIPFEQWIAHKNYNPDDPYTNPDDLRIIMENLPFVGPTIQRYWGTTIQEIFSKTDTVKAPAYTETFDRGSVRKGLERIEGPEEKLAAFVPSIFGGVQRNYYFAYSSGMIYMTHSEEKLRNNLERGAAEIYASDDPRVAKPYRQWAQRSYPTRIKKFYAPYAKKPKRKYAKKVYTKKTYFKKVYTKRTPSPKRFDYGVQSRIMTSVRKTQFRMPGGYRNVSHVAPSLYRKQFSTKGTLKFKQRMIPVTAYNLAAKLRSDWAYLR